MPSRLGVACILVFWAATAGLVGYREVWPRLTAGDPPGIAAALTDEATSLPTAHWGVFRGDDRVGRLTTRAEYVRDDDTYRFTSAYRDLHFRIPLQFGLGAVDLHSPDLTTVVRVTREGTLREQRMSGELRASFGGPELVGRADVTGHVVGGHLVGRCRVESPFGPPIDRDLDPVPVPDGQVLNPLMPLGKLAGVRPGMRPWRVRPVDPLADAVKGLVQQAAQNSKVAAGVLASGGGDRELIGTVRPAAVRFEKPGHAVECWVIDYAGDDVTATTWVAVADGKVLRQEAVGLGERLRFERED